MEFIIQNYGFLGFIGGIVLSIGGLFWFSNNHEKRLCRLEEEVDSIKEIKIDLKWIKETLDLIKKKLNCL